MCIFSSKSEGVPFQPLGDLTWNDPKVFPVPGNFGGMCYTTWQLCCGNNQGWPDLNQAI